MVSDAAILRGRCERIDWSKRPANEEARGWRVFVAKEMDEIGYVWVDDKAKIQVYGPDTWRMLGRDVKVRYEVIAQIEKGAGGIRSLPLHVEPYTSLVLMDAKLNGTDVVQSTDRLIALRQKATRLLEETESVRALGVSLRGAQVHALRFEQAQQEFNELAEELARLDSLLRLVGIVVNAAIS